MAKTIPDIEIKDLEEGARNCIRSLIRNFCINCNIFKLGNMAGLGLDETEECMEKLLNKGEIKFIHNTESKIMILKKWDSISEEYI